MALPINPNSSSLMNRNTLNNLEGVKQSAQERLASGQRINSAADDAAGLEIANKLLSQFTADMQASRNASDGVSLTQVADSALGGISDMVNRMHELAVQASNGTLSDSNRASLQSEFSQLQDQISDTVQQTQFNGISVIGNDDEISIQLGDNTLDFAISDLTGNSGVSDLLNASIGTLDDASSALGMVGDAQAAIGEARSNMGAVSNRLEQAYNASVESAHQNAANRSRIADADMAAEASRNASADILSQVNIAMQAQANQDKQLVSQLLGL